MRTVRRSFTPLTFSSRIASIMMADPAASSVAPVPVCHESKWHADRGQGELVGRVGSSGLATDGLVLGSRGRDRRGRI